MKSRISDTNHVREAALRELEKLTQMLESDPYVIYSMSESDMRQELRELGLDSGKLGPKMDFTSGRETGPKVKPTPSRSSSQLMRRPKERECFHRIKGAEGEFYNGMFYLQALSRLQVDAAIQMAAKVTSFFWADAPDIVVWLCRDCAEEVGLLDRPSIVEEIRGRRA